MSGFARQSVSPGHSMDPGFLGRLQGALYLFAFAAIALGWAYALWHVYSDREQTLDAARQQLLTVGAALNVHTEALLADGIGAAEAAAAQVVALGLGGQPPDAIAATIQRELTGGDYVRALFIVNAQGIAIAGRSGYRFSDRALPSWLQQIRANPGRRAFVGQPMLHPGNPREQIIPVARRIALSDGGVLWAGAWFGVDALHRRHLNLTGRDGVIVLIGPGATILVHASTGMAPRGNTPTEMRSMNMFLREIAAVGLTPVIIEGMSPLNRQQMVYSVSRATSEFALYVAAGRTRDSILSAWRYRTVVVVVVVLGSTALLLLLLLLLQRFIAELNRREFQLRKLYDSSLVSILLLQDGRILQANQTTARMFRLPPGRTMAGAHPWEFSPPHQPDGTDSRQRSAQYLETADREGSVTFRWMHKRIDNDEPFAADVNLSSIRIDAHSLTLAIVHDVSELEAAQTQLERANATLEARVAERTAALEQVNARLALANIELEQFTASASHDLRSPLTAISGQAGLLEGMLSAADEQVRQRIDRIQTAVARAADVIDGLLSLSRISRQDLRAEPVCLSTLARQTIEDLRDQYPSRPCRYDIDENVEVVADQRLMKSLLQNLIGNAWKYSAPRDCTYIEFHCEANDGAPVYRVTDHGIGFSMERAGLLFQPFKRLHTPQEFPGTGIGLAIVARIVHRYGGKVWAHAEVGSGATFFFTLPLAQAGAGQAHTGGTGETATRASPAAG